MLGQQPRGNTQTSSSKTRRVPALQDLTLADLPPRIGLLPLAETILLPQGQLPLTVFEPRYIALLEASLAQHRMIGIIQPHRTMRFGDETPPLETVGTLGRITSFMEQESGQFFITLTGICRFRLLQDQTTQDGWREARINAMPFSHDLLEAPTCTLDRPALSAALKNYSQHHNLAIKWDNLKTLDNNILLTMLSMLLPFSSATKQALLECDNPCNRAHKLLEELTR